MRVNFRQAARPRLLVVALAGLVFALAFQAKLSLYDPPHSGSVNPVSASKLWVAGEKLKITTPWLVPVLWLPLFFSSPPLRRIGTEVGKPPAPRRFILSELYRFLRPPPAT
jgi:hypothetical protein